MNKPSNAKRGRNKRRKASHILVNYSGPSYSDLPSNIVENILLRLSLKRILVCKCVCKTWNDLVSNPEFAKLHFNQAQFYPLIQTSGFTALSRMVYLVQPEKDDFELKLDCYHNSQESMLGCDCKVKVKLNSKFRLPLRNLEMIDNGESEGEFNSDFEAERTIGLKLNMKDHKYKIVNSCNGLLCLSDPSNNEPLIICNPVTGEFINLPAKRKVGDPDIVIACGFGFSPMTNQYKVIRMFTPRFEDDMRGYVVGVEIHILGTNSWKYLGKFQYSADELAFPTYLNGNLYWYYHVRHSVMFFDIQKDCFDTLPRTLSEECYRNGILSMGVLGGELCLTESFSDDRIDYWVTKDCDDGEKYWIKMPSIKINDYDGLLYGSYKPIKYLNNGAMLFYNVFKQAFLYHNPKKLGYRYFKICGMQSKVEAISHIPSFVSLKDAVQGLNTEVLNVRSRCGELKLYNEGKGISIVEKVLELVDDSDDSDDTQLHVSDVEVDS